MQHSSTDLAVSLPSALQRLSHVKLLREAIVSICLSLSASPPPKASTLASFARGPHRAPRLSSWFAIICNHTQGAR